jgi:hypothetical protein
MMNQIADVAVPQCVGRLAGRQFCGFRGELTDYCPGALVPGLAVGAGEQGADAHLKVLSLVLYACKDDKEHVRRVTGRVGSG